MGFSSLLLRDAAQDRFPPPPVKYIQTVLALLLFPVLCPRLPASPLRLVTIVQPPDDLKPDGMPLSRASPLCLVTIVQPPDDLKPDGMPLSRALTAPSLFPSWP